MDQEEQDQIIRHLQEIKGEIGKTEKLSEDLQQLSRALDKLIIQVENLDENQDDIEDDVRKIEQEIQKLRQDYARLNPGELKDRIQGIEDHIDQVSQKSASPDWQSQTDSRLNDVEKAVQKKVDTKTLVRYGLIIAFFIGLIGTMISWAIQVFT